MHLIVSLVVLICVLVKMEIRAAAVHATFHVHYPWLTRGPNPPTRSGLRAFNPFCRQIIHNPQKFSGWQPTFVSFSGMAGDLVSVSYTRNRAPRSAADFPFHIATDVPIAPSGQLCFDVQLPEPAWDLEYGVLLFEARDPKTKELVGYHCSDIRLVDEVALGSEHPAMCARNNETLIPMPKEFL
ncbi:hypothetical protein HGRIS_002047 [Hohenbuehelia grisea]|uniref:Uncharacterized protein n=1 Tax=Hohenbuehelia grisea TaxID=104357 RepID=A0ABR3JK38_9AGAR